MILRAAVFLAAILLFHPALAERKVALLIGNAEYSAPATILKNPPRDVAAMKAMLESAHFDVSVIENAGRAAMSTTLADFEAKVEGADVGLIYYSGHGMELLGENFLIPIDAKLASDRVVKYEAIELEHLLQTLNGATKLKLVLLDACRDNPFLTAMKRTLTKGGLSKGLAPVGSRESNLLVGYATAEGDVALDGAGETSPYVEALVRHLTTPGQEIEAALRAVAKDVYDTTGGKQRPFKTGSMFETVMLVPTEEKSKPSVEIAQPAADLCRDAGTHWSAISGRGNKALLEEHIRLFGTCAFASVAKLEIAALEPDQSQLPATVEKVVSAATDTGKASDETECDRLAARPRDPMKLASVEGIDFEKLRLPEALKACETAAETFPGEIRLAYQLGRALDKSENYQNAVSRYRQAAEGGYVAAMTNMGVLYREGQGVKKDYKEARAWFDKAVEGGDGAAMTHIGLLYENAQGVKRNYKEAVNWYRKGAEKGDDAAMYNIGVSYENGQGVKKDYKEAISWYRKAAEHGDDDAMYNIGILYENGHGVTRDSQEAAQYVETSIRSGAQFSLTQMKTNSGVWSRDFRKALQQRLKDAGVYDGDIDGSFGPGTIRAIEAIFDKG